MLASARASLAELGLRHGLLETDLFAGMVELLLFISDEFGIEAEDGEITEANLGSLARIAAFVVAKRSRAAAAA